MKVLRLLAGPRLSAWIALLFVFGSGLSTQAETQRVRQAQTAVDKARQALKTAQQALDRASQSAQHADAALQAANDAVTRLKKKLTEKEGAKLGLTQAIIARDNADQEMKRSRDRIWKGLKSRAGYLTTSNQAESASQRLEGLSEEKFTNDEERERVRSELSSRIRQPYELQSAELSQDASFQQKLRDLQDAIRRMMEIEQQIPKLVEADPAMIKARAAAEKAPKASAEAHQQESKAWLQISAAQAALDHANEQHRLAVAEEHRLEHRR